jgi:hypothetical protein
MLKIAGKIGLVVLLTVWLYSGNLFAQNGDEYNKNTNRSTTQDNTSMKMGNFDAQSLSQDLASHIKLDQDQTGKIRDILNNYHSKIQDIEGIQRAALRDETKTGTSGTGSGSSSGSYGTGTGNKSNTNPSVGTNDRTDRTGTAVNNNSSDLMESLRQNDIQANNDIEKVINDNQKSAWMTYKSTWWQEVKQSAYADVAGNNMDNMNNMHNNNMNNMHNNNMNNMHKNGMNNMHNNNMNHRNNSDKDKDNDNR